MENKRSIEKLIAEEKMLTFEQFCAHFGEPKPEGYSEIGEAYLQYEYDFFYGGYVSADDYWRAKKQSNKK